MTDQSEKDVTEFIEALREFQPNIVVLDTLATATAGQDENSSQMSAFLTANGPVGRIRAAFHALVIVIAHQGKDREKKVRGHSGILGNADVGLQVTADKDSGTIEVFVEKMRDGRDRFKNYFEIEWKGPANIPVPRKITEAKYQSLKSEAKRQEVRPVDPNDEVNRLRDKLVGYGAIGFENGLSDGALAERLVDEIYLDMDASDQEILCERATQRKQLANRRRTPERWGAIYECRAVEGTNRKEWRWFAAPEG